MSHLACVYLVGTGPGDADLLTIKALRLIQNADVIVYDRLVSKEILALIPKGTARIYVGKSSGNHTLKQTEINQLLVKCAEKSRKVVRLKGGDPFVFGRGSEEALHLINHKVPFEVVPGVTAASAVTTYAGIPLTHRGLSQGVQIITGHGKEDRPLDFDWKKIADKSRTIVVYMGLNSIGEISQQLIAHGLSESTPVAAIENGATIKQRRIISSLETVEQSVKQNQLSSPVLFVIGKVVTLAEQLDWYSAIQQTTAEQNEVPVEKLQEQYSV